MARFLGRFLAAVLVAGGFIAATAVDGHALIGARAGMFLPNDNSDGLKGFEEGWAAEVFLGGGVGPVGFEVGAGGYMPEPEGNVDADFNVYYLSGTVKGYLPLGGAALYAGGGIGFYYAELDSGLEGRDTVDGNGIGYHLVMGVEAPLAIVALFGEARWNLAEVDLGNLREDIDVGGLTISLGLRF